MVDSSVSETTQLLRAWAEGDERAQKILIPRVYRELRRVAGHCLKNERSEQTFQVSDLVHEAYLHLADLSRLDWQHRNHFFAVSATLMRRILVDRARRRIAAKRGQRAQGIDVEHALDVSSKRPTEIVAWMTPSTNWPASLPERAALLSCVFSRDSKSGRRRKLSASLRRPSSVTGKWPRHGS